MNPAGKSLKPSRGDGGVGLQHTMAPYVPTVGLGGQPSPSTQELALKLHHLLRTGKQHLFTVESCSGGALAAAITAVSGVSAWYAGGMVTYANAAKQRLGVAETLLKRYGAVSVACVSAMAEAGLAYSGADICIATTGFTDSVASGEEGDLSGTAKQGDVFIACAYCSAKKIITTTLFGHCEGNRHTMVSGFVQLSLGFVLDTVTHYRKTHC